MSNIGQKPETMPGITIGIVVETEDPEQLGRVKLRLPMLGEEVLSDWARVATYFTGEEYGNIFRPRVGTEVLVGFLHGNPNQPYVLGSLYNGQDRPPVPQEEQEFVYKLKTPGGHSLTFNETEGEMSITIEDAQENSITIKSDENQIRLKANTAITLTAVDESISLQAPRISLTGEEEVSINGSQISISGEGEVAINGAMVRLN